MTSLVGRVKKLLPECIVTWYGYFSSNFAHFGPAHSAPYVPRRCWPDNWVLVTGIQNIVRGSVAFGIILERLYFHQTDHPVFWRAASESGILVFDEEGPVWDWIDGLGKEIISQYPPDERKKGFIYSDRPYKLR